jgi:hypothetical protein
MKLSDPAKEVLRTAERQLVALAHEAGTNRDYEAATSLLEAARRVKCMADGELMSEGSRGAVLLPEPSEARAGLKSDDSGIAQSARPHRKSSYPKFLRDGDSLVKVGWSKSDKSEYEHKSPKKVLSALGAALINVGANGRRFSMDKVLPISDPADGIQLPDYQSYLSLALLRENGLVIQHGRQGYSLPKKGDLLLSIEKLWDQLPNRS